MEIPEALSHLNLCVSDNRVIKKKNAMECVYDNLRGCHSLCQGIARPALIARPWSALTLMSITYAAFLHHSATLFLSQVGGCLPSTDNVTHMAHLLTP